VVSNQQSYTDHQATDQWQDCSATSRATLIIKRLISGKTVQQPAELH